MQLHTIELAIAHTFRHQHSGHSDFAHGLCRGIEVPGLGVSPSWFWPLGITQRVTHWFTWLMGRVAKVKLRTTLSFKLPTDFYDSSVSYPGRVGVGFVYVPSVSLRLGV